jgi:hypothetical protein
LGGNLLGWIQDHHAGFGIGQSCIEFERDAARRHALEGIGGQRFAQLRQDALTRVHDDDAQVFGAQVRIVGQQRREGEPIGVELLDPCSHDQAFLLVDGGSPGKERGGVSVGSHPQQYQIEARQLPFRKPEELPQVLLIFVRRSTGIGVFRLDAMRM